MSLADLEREKYEKIWTFPLYRQFSPGEQLVGRAIESLEMQPGDSVIDYGCGSGRATRCFQDLGFDVTGIDHASNCLDEGIDVPFIQMCLWEPFSLTSDFAFCADVMEHIPEEYTGAVIASIAKRTHRGAFFQIHLGPDSSGPRLLGEPLHLTQKTADWWGQLLSDYWFVDMTVQATRATYVCR